METPVIENGHIVHHSRLCGRTDRYRIVDHFPPGYIVWNIGRDNFPFEGYVPLARETDIPHHIDLKTLRALKVNDEDTALRMIEAAGYRTVRCPG